jgi:hypothetical protein
MLLDTNAGANNDVIGPIDLYLGQLGPIDLYLVIDAQTVIDSINCAINKQKKK